MSSLNSTDNSLHNIVIDKDRPNNGRSMIRSSSLSTGAERKLRGSWINWIKESYVELHILGQNQFKEGGKICKS